MAITVYVAGPLSGDMQANAARAIDVGERLLAAGLVPFIPHLTIAWEARHPHHYEQWMAWDFEWLRRCDALYRMPGKSPGADREVDMARQLGIPVFVEAGDVVAWAKKTVDV